MKKISERFGLDLFLPTSHGYSNKVNVKFEDVDYFRTKSIGRGCIELETTKGDRLLKSLDDVIDTFTKSTNFISIPTLDSFLKWVDKETILGLLPPFSKRYFYYKGHKISFLPGRDQFTIDRCRICRIDKFARRSLKIESLSDVQTVANELERLSKIINYNPLSTASTVSTTLLDTENKQQFDLLNFLNPPEVDLIMNCYYALSQENAFIGNLGTVQAVDESKAYLVHLGNLRSMAKSDNIIYRKTHRHPDAWTGWFEIEASNPDIRFPVFPYRDKKGRPSHPRGPLGVISVHSSTLDLADALEIPYKILSSVQLIPLNKSKTPFKEICNALQYLMANQEAMFPNINLKAMYYSCVGHMFHYHEVVDLKNPQGRIYVTSSDFSPQIATTITSEVENEVRSLLLGAVNPLFQSSDGGAADRFPNLPDIFKDLGTGQGFSFDPSLKDKPGKTPSKNIGLVAQMVHKYRDDPEIRVRLPFLKTAANSWMQPLLIGGTGWRTTSRYPGCGPRLLEKIPKRLGELEDRVFPSNPPQVVREGQIDSGYFEPLDLLAEKYLLGAEYE